MKTLFMVDLIDVRRDEIEAEPIVIFTRGGDTVDLVLPDGSILRARRQDLLTALSHPDSKRDAA